MADLVGTCPKDFWLEWIAEGDAAGDPYTGEEWGWYTRHSHARFGEPGDRFYVVAHGLLRGYAPITRVVRPGETLVIPKAGGPPIICEEYIICRRGGAVACTIGTPIPGFRGIAKRWWPRALERDFPDWKTAGVQIKGAKSPAPQPVSGGAVRVRCLGNAVVPQVVAAIARAVMENENG